MITSPLRFILPGILLATSAFAGSPRLKSLYPSGGQRGTEVEVTLSGDRLDDARELLFDAPGFTAVEFIKPDEKNKSMRVKIAVPADARLGEHRFRVATASGISDLRLFYVTPFPMVEEAKEETEVDQPPQPIALGATVYGRTQREDADTYEVEAKKGTRISAEVIAARLQTQRIYDTVVSITKADGTRIAQADDVAFSRQDPALSVIAPEDGKYLISIRDSTNSGEAECHYLMNIGSFPRPLAVYPAGGPAGEEVTFTLLGDAGGPIQRTIKLPGAPTPDFSIFTEDGQPAPQPNIVRVSPFPNVLEAEPNNDITTATVTELEMPFALNGIVQDKGDVDCFKFKAKKEVQYELRVYAREVRSPLDSVLTVYNEKGSRLASNDDAGGPDSYQRWKAPEDGEYFLQVNDQLMRGGPTFTYRVEVTAIAPEVTAWLPEMVQNSNQERRAIVVPQGNRYATLVRVKRAEMGGDLTFEPQGLPDGITVSAPVMDKSVDTIPMVFEAPAGAAIDARAIEMKVNVVEPPKDGPAIVTRVANDLDVADNGNQKSFYAVSESTLPAAVTEEIPVKITLAQPKVPILRNGAMVLKVTAERKNDYKGRIELALLYSPPGIGNAGTVAIKEGENEGTVTISANDKAPVQTWKVCVVGAADFGKGPVWMSTDLVDLEIAEPFVSGKFERSFVDQGEEGAVTLKLEGIRDFDGKARIELQSLPAGVTAEPVEVAKGAEKVTFKIKAAPDAQAGQHKQLIAKFFLTKDGEEMSNTIAGGGILRVDKAAVAKK